jgi:spermidine synthase
MTDTRVRQIPALLLLLSALFFLSGTSALVYQVLWLRLLGLVFGVTVYAASTVWAVFMAGLAIGSLTGGRLADRVRQPLVWFGAAEALIALTALATPAALNLLQDWYATLHPSLNTSLATLTATRLAISFSVLIIPSALMGATLPLVVKSSLFRTEGLGGRVGVLYATNTAGAIAGSLLAGLLFIPRFGIYTSFLIAAALNLLVAAVALAVGRRSASRAPVGTPAPEARTVVGTLPNGVPAVSGDTADLRRLIVLAVFAVSGFVSLALEVVWFRVLTLFLRPTVYGYAMMLAAVLGGIALGSYAAAPWLRRRPHGEWLLTLAWLEGGIAIAAVASLLVLPAIPQLVDLAGPAVAMLTGDYLSYQAIISFAVILPPMLLFGVAFPIGLHVWGAAGSDRPERVATRIGVFYSLNVAGAIAGSLAAGFLLLPRHGSRGTLLGLAVVALVSGFALAAVSRRPAVLRLVSVAVMSLVFVAAARAAPDPFEAFLEQRYPGQTIVWQREAVQATVSVHEDRHGAYTLNVNGNHQASTAGSMPAVHHRIGNLPMAVHPDARDALIIGLGGGATAGAVAQHTGVLVDIVELSREVVQAADRFFRGINFGVLRKPNVSLRVDDGRNYLLLTDRRYDVVTADVILPIHAGSGNLYSAEYFSLVRRALKPGGLALQWVAGTDAEYRLIMRTFLSVFPETTLWADGGLMVGSVEPLRLRRSDFEWKLDVPGRREMLASLGVQSFEDLLGLYIAGPEELRAYVGEGPILTDDRPLVEYFLSLPRDRQVDLSGVKGDVSRHVR